MRASFRSTTSIGNPERAELAKPHCGDRQSCSTGTKRAASSIRFLSISVVSRSGNLVETSPSTTLLVPFGTNLFADTYSPAAQGQRSLPAAHARDQQRTPFDLDRQSGQATDPRSKARLRAWASWPSWAAALAPLEKKNPPPTMVHGDGVFR